MTGEVSWRVGAVVRDRTTSWLGSITPFNGPLPENTLVSEVRAKIESEFNVFGGVPGMTCHALVAPLVHSHPVGRLTLMDSLMSPPAARTATDSHWTSCARLPVNRLKGLVCASGS